jgi:hypothetical protein
LLGVLTARGGAVKAVVGIVIVLIVHCLTTPSIKEPTPSNAFIQRTRLHLRILNLAGELRKPESADEVLGEGLAFTRREVDALHHLGEILPQTTEEFPSGDETFNPHCRHLLLFQSVGVSQTLQKVDDVVYGSKDVLHRLGIRIGRRRHPNDESQRTDRITEREPREFVLLAGHPLLGDVPFTHKGINDGLEEQLKLNAGVLGHGSSGGCDSRDTGSKRSFRGRRSKTLKGSLCRINGVQLTDTSQKPCLAVGLTFGRTEDTTRDRRLHELERSSRAVLTSRVQNQRTRTPVGELTLGEGGRRHSVIVLVREEHPMV